MSDILSKLQKLGVTRGFSEKHTIAKKGEIDAFQALQFHFPQGTIEENRYGLVFNNRIVYPISTQHGRITLNAPLHDSEHFRALLNVPFSFPKTETLAMDIETSGLSSTSASFVFMIGMGYFTENGYVIDQYILPDMGYEKPFLAQIEQTMLRFSILLTYNGKSFDLPMIQSRGNFHFLPMIGAEITHVDFLPIVRKYWKKNLENCRLSTVEQKILQLQRGTEETPGYLAPEIYREFLQTQTSELLRGIAYHNEIDVLSLSAFLLLVSQIAARPIEQWEEKNEYLFSADALKKKTALQRMEEANPRDFCHGQVFSTAERRKAAAAFKKEKNWQDAERVYQSLANEGDLESIFALIRSAPGAPADKETIRKYVKMGIDFLEKDNSIGRWTKEEKKKKLLMFDSKLRKEEERR